MRHMIRTTCSLGMGSLFLVLAVCATYVIAAQVRQPEKGADTVDGGTYKNPELGISIVLPGRWGVMRSERNPTDSNTPVPGCDGPLCGHAQIIVSLDSLSETGQNISMVAYRLSPPYLDRKRYPLKRFAEVMTKDSLGGSNWIPNGDLTSITLGGKPAYRLLLHQRVSSKIGFGYVAESNGYMFLLIGDAFSGAESLQSAIEAMTFSKPS
jgi:hypothetical protein